MSGFPAAGAWLAQLRGSSGSNVSEGQAIDRQVPSRPLPDPVLSIRTVRTTFEA